MGHAEHNLNQTARINAVITGIWLVHQGNHRQDALAAEKVFTEPGDRIIVADHAWIAQDRQIRVLKVQAFHSGAQQAGRRDHCGWRFVRIQPGCLQGS